MPATSFRRLLWLSMAAAGALLLTDVALAQNRERAPDSQQAAETRDSNTVGATGQSKTDDNASHEKNQQHYESAPGMARGGKPEPEKVNPQSRSLGDKPNPELGGKTPADRGKGH